jgi:hypothetical protein
LIFEWTLGGEMAAFTQSTNDSFDVGGFSRSFSLWLDLLILSA